MSLLYLLSGQTRGSAPTVGCNLSLYKVTLAFCEIDALGGMQNPFRRHSSLVGEMLGKGYSYRERSQFVVPSSGGDH